MTRNDKAALYPKGGRGHGGCMQLGTIARIPIRLHWSWFVGVAVYAAGALFVGGPFAVLTTFVYAVGLFGIVVMHELGHALAARVYGIDTAHITLYPFGGVAAITDMPRSPRQELVIAAAGPAVNLVLAVGFGVLWLLAGPKIFAVLTGINLAMGLFNLIPAYPMDGGRVLRAVIASQRGWDAANRIALRVGTWFAWGFIALGAVALQPSLVLVGGFVLFAISAERRRMAHLRAAGWRPAPAWNSHRSPRAPSSPRRWRINPTYGTS